MSAGDPRALIERLRHGDRRWRRLSSVGLVPLGVAALSLMIAAGVIWRQLELERRAARRHRWHGYQAVPRVEQHLPWSSDEDPATRPFATWDGAAITLRPSGASFHVPPDWICPFHLSHAELDAVAQGAGEWYTEYASVCNAALPFDRCAIHLGAFGGNGVVSMQVRVYDLADDAGALARAVEARAVADIRRFLGRDPQVVREASGPWRKVTLSFWLFYYDYGGMASVEFRLRRCGDRTFVFVFMDVIEDPNKIIPGILDSFKPPGPPHAEK